MRKLGENKAFTLYIWIFGVFLLGQINQAQAGPMIAAKPRSDIQLGPCTWVIDRKCPDDDVKFYIFTRKNPQDRQYIYIDDTWEKSNLSTSHFNNIHPVKIIIHGYNSDMFLHPLIQMKDEYLQRGEYNLIYVDWSNLAPGPCYISAVHNVRHTGKCIAQLMERVLEAGTANMHLIGFSLGAQVTNFVAQSLDSFTIPRITGLDPAMPLFITASTDDKLDKSDAAFVDIMHTNALVQGKIERCGHVDFYMNGGIMQPGCFGQGENIFACSHHRAPDYFAESIRTYRGFWGWLCSSYISYLLGLCPPTNYLILAGEDCNPDSDGMYLITTNDVSPFARGKWTDLKTESIETQIHMPTPLTRHNILAQQIDQWGKLDGFFNNIEHFPTPYSQDPNGGNWPYFSEYGTRDITDDVNDNVDESRKSSSKPQERPASIPLIRNRNRTINHNTRNSEPRKPNNNSKINDRSNFLQSYRQNLTLGIFDPNVFKLPTVQVN